MRKRKREKSRRRARATAAENKRGAQQETKNMPKGSQKGAATPAAAVVTNPRIARTGRAPKTGTDGLATGSIRAYPTTEHPGAGWGLCSVYFFPLTTGRGESDLPTCLSMYQPEVFSVPGWVAVSVACVIIPYRFPGKLSPAFEDCVLVFVLP